MAPRPSDDPRVRRFALAGPPEGGRFLLAAGEAEHARRVLRLRVGDRLLGLDGAGAAWPLVVVNADARGFEVASAGEPEREPAPGEHGAALPWIEVCVALPRGERAEALVERLVQLGVAAIRPLAAQRASPEARAEGTRRATRLVRAAREACKQAVRLWVPEIHPLEEPMRALTRAASLDLRLDPRDGAAAFPALAALDPWGTRAAPVRLWVGPEGGFTEEEVAALDAAGARALRLGPHILRIETAAEAGLALVAAAAHARRHAELAREQARR
ncbi:MAG: RsmE family RNA methyltransferase [Planctomycetes bacterium]|nr:RsmE family RNA methyltransferase [Planctomycetota bacterium]